MSRGDPSDAFTGEADDGHHGDAILVVAHPQLPVAVAAKGVEQTGGGDGKGEAIIFHVVVTAADGNVLYVFGMEGVHNLWLPGVVGVA